MAASPNLSQPTPSGKSLISKSGVLTVHGFGVRVRMQAGHLEIEDGVADERRRVRLARVGHRLRRLVCIAEDGFFTIDALKWLADQNASLIMLERSGKVSLVTGPTAPSDGRLHRAQALARHSGAALKIMREIMRAKLEGQEQLVRNKLENPTAAGLIAKLRESLFTAADFDGVAKLERQAALIYWSAWNEVQIMFPRQDLARTPQHWRMFGTRRSPLTGSARLATNPPNALLNYCYALLESEARLAATACGLDPCLGMLHADTPTRDSLACDIMEAVRPSVDAWLLNWILREPFRRSDFFEESNGNCRLLKNLTLKLSETTPTWGKLVAPWAEYVARTLWSSSSTSRSQRGPSTPLTQQHRRVAKDRPSFPVVRVPEPDRLCRACGKKIPRDSAHCAQCNLENARKRLVEVAREGRIAGHTSEAIAKEAATHRRHGEARRKWKPSDQPEWLTREVFRERIQPVLAHTSATAIAKQIGVSVWYAGKIKQGYLPHPRHWSLLAELARNQTKPMVDSLDNAPLLS